MSVERQLIAALRRADEWQPRPDLFARVQRSIAEDRAHRRRVRRVAAGLVVAVAAIVGLFATVAVTSPSGALSVPRWSIELVETAVLCTLLVVFAPVIRRFGAAYVADVFGMRPGIDRHVLRLLDIAYALTLSGWILDGLDLERLSSAVPAVRGIAESLLRIAMFLTALGVAHTVVVAALPVVGLVYSAVVRRALRREAGPMAPAASAAAVQADRLAGWIVLAAGAVAVLGVTLLAGVIVGTGLPD